MTDQELIARLHKIACHIAADRIEALIAEREAARAERAKAVDRAIATLAEIKGESHD